MNSTVTSPPIRLQPGPWVLEVLDAEGRLRHRFPLPVGHHQLGSAPEASVRLEGPGVSRRHAELAVRPDGCLELLDLGSKNGTAIDGRRIARHVLRQATDVGFAGVAARLRPEVGAVQRLFAGGTVAPAPRPDTGHLELRRTYDEAARLARGTIPLLLLGESGSGKEVLARFIHTSSARADGPFLAINCAALPTELLEAELFGIEKGVATGVEARPGLLERCHGGTLFLDEIGDLPLPLQAKVLRVLEGAAYHRVGGRQARRADVRFLAATHVDLPRRIAEERFRADLFYRLAAATLELPPLRARREDVPLLAVEFFTREITERGLMSPGITERALGALLAHDWPGNVRELRHEIARAVLLLAPGEPLDLHHLRPQLRGSEVRGLTLAEAQRHAERAAFHTALRLAAGDPVQARQLLDVSRTTFYRKLRELGGDGTPEDGTRDPGFSPRSPEDDPEIHD